MKNKIIIPTILSILIGGYLGYLIFNQYKYNNSDVATFNEGNIPIYFLQQGVYSSIESMNENTNEISDYIYFKEDNKYKVYIGITTNKDNVEKITNIFKDKNYDIYTKEINIEDKAFIEKLKQYDELIKASEDQNVILGLLKQILNEYEQVMKNSE